MTIAPQRLDQPLETESEAPAHREPAPRPRTSAHLSSEQIDELGRELDALRAEIIDARGSRDAAYIRRVIAVQRSLNVDALL